MAKLHLYLLLVFDPDPKVTGHHRAVWADDKFAQLHLFLVRLQHAGMHKADIRDAPEFFVVMIERFLNLHAQRGARVVIEPK
jgi:hypothetical protein